MTTIIKPEKAMKEKYVDELIQMIAEMLEECGSFDVCRDTYLHAQASCSAFWEGREFEHRQKASQSPEA